MIRGRRSGREVEIGTGRDGSVFRGGAPPFEHGPFVQVGWRWTGRSLQPVHGYGRSTLGWFSGREARQTAGQNQLTTGKGEMGRGRDERDE